MKTVDLEEIKEKYGSIGKETCEGYQHEHILEAMREACNQAVELCAENAELIKYTDNFGDPDKYLDKNSILNTKSQII